MTGRDEVVAFAPASVGNVAVGFDVLGHSMDAVGDRVVARRIAAREVRIAAVRGLVLDLPLEASRNTAGVAVPAPLATSRAGPRLPLSIPNANPPPSPLAP